MIYVWDDKKKIAVPQDEAPQAEVSEKVNPYAKPKEKPEK